MSHRIAIVTPLYKQVPSITELAALKHGYTVLNQHKLFVVVPENLELSGYREVLQQCTVMRLDAKHFTGIGSYNRLLLSKYFYRLFANFDYVLIFQPDAMVFRDELEQWCDYGFDYIGAPWPKGRRTYPYSFRGCSWLARMLPWFNKPVHHFVGNGGLSLRKVSSALETLEKHWLLARFWIEYEDVFWSLYSPKVPDEMQASLFALERTPSRYFALNGNRLPFGCHAWEKYEPNFWRAQFSQIGLPDELGKPPRLPSISIIVAVYNRSATIQQCLDSIAQQTYADRQLIVIDGGSTDGTVEILKENQQKIAYWISEPDRGIYHAWNKGLQQATGEWIYFLGADDYFWDNHVLEHMAEDLSKLPENIRVAYGQIMLLDAGGTCMQAAGQPWQEIKQRFSKIMCIPHQSVMHRRSLFELHGLFDPSFRIAGDYELLLRELKEGEAAFIPDIIVAGMRQGGVSSKPENSLALLREARRAQRKNGLSQPNLLWLRLMLNAYIRWLLWRMLGERNARRTFDFARRLLGLPPFWTRT